MSLESDAGILLNPQFGDQYDPGAWVAAKFNERLSHLGNISMQIQLQYG